MQTRNIFDHIRLQINLKWQNNIVKSSFFFGGKLTLQAGDAAHFVCSPIIEFHFFDS